MQHATWQCLLLLTFALSVLEPHVSTALGQQYHYGIIAQLRSQHDRGAALLVPDVRVCSLGKKEADQVCRESRETVRRMK